MPELITRSHISGITLSIPIILGGRQESTSWDSGHDATPQGPPLQVYFSGWGVREGTKA